MCLLCGQFCYCHSDERPFTTSSCPAYMASRGHVYPRVLSPCGMVLQCTFPWHHYPPRNRIRIAHGDTQISPNPSFTCNEHVRHYSRMDAIRHNAMLYYQTCNKRLPSTANTSFHPPSQSDRIFQHTLPSLTS